MGPFVLDAALRGADRETRERALRDPSFGAKLLAGPPFGERVGLVVADLVEIPLDPREGGGAGRSASGRDGAWPAGEILLGSDLFAVECVGHRILSNALEGRGIKAPAAHPILAAAAGLGIPGARLETLSWKKASL
jgi:hypothetical protein